ncbi:MAG: sigma-70 family RNA polymerase sigma factor [Synechococcus sp. cluster2_bin.235]|nr:sigma-70 family RNA polymerase sigma factor [Synechococcus sp. cluster2_bin.235]
MPSTQSLRRREQRRSLPKSILERNDAVLEHLGLAHHAAIHQAVRYPGEQDDLVQEGRVGLIHGVANFDPQRGFRISTYVLARVNGQILHFRRDRQHTLRIPWRLKDLHSRGMRLQAQRLQQSLELLDERGLAASLNVSPQRWQEALMAHAVGHVDSLDVVPAIQSLGGEQRRSLINQIEDPLSVPSSLEDPHLCWLQDALKMLEPQQRCWLLARYVDNISIQDLALRERVSPGLLRQSIRTSLSLLRQAAPAPQHSLQQHGLPSASKTERERDQYR